MEILPIASGKGGVGKSVVAVNLAGALAQTGKSVVLCDFDLGGANLHTLLGMRNNSAGLGNFIYKQVASIEPLLQETAIPNLSFIAGDCLYPGTPNLDFFTKKKLIKELSLLPGDYAVLDLGGGSTYNILDFYLMTRNSVLVTTAEITSILNAYSFLKAAVFRFLNGMFSAKSPERAFIHEAIRQNPRGTDFSVLSVFDALCARFPESGEKAHAALSGFCPQIILNRGRDDKDLDMARRLRSLVRSKLNVALDFIGFFPEDADVPLSVAKRTPLCVSSPDGKFMAAVQAAAQRVVAHEYGLNDDLMEDGQEEDSDLERLRHEFPWEGN